MSELQQILQTIERRRQIFRIEYYKPYEYQKRFHNVRGFKSDQPADQKVLMAGNQVGKTLCAASEVAYHATGNYPDWWDGRRFSKAVTILVGGKTNETVRDICQKELFGEPGDPAKKGTGTVPLVALGKSTSKPGVPNALDTQLVKHKNGGWSKIMFRAYEQGREKHMGIRIDVGWPDEEPPQEIWSQYIRATIATNGLLLMTFTPEDGITQVVNGFMHDIQPGQALVNASWNDAPHLTNPDGTLTERAQQRMASFPAYEREMRTKGVPFMGSGLIFPFTEEQIVVEPFEIPRHWPRIIGIDFGFDHAFGAAQLAWDRDSDTVYLITDYKETRAIPIIHCAALKPWGAWPVAWPHDGLNTEKTTGDELRKPYVDGGLLMLQSKATNPPDAAQGQNEGEGGNSVEASILSLYERMEKGQFKVFKTCRHWLSEQRMYHRKDGKIVKMNDDVISASRYAHMMLRHARTETVRRRARQFVAGVSNW